MMEANDVLLSCPKCGHKQSKSRWCREAVFGFDGMISAVQHHQLEDLDLHSTEGDHARCPKCNTLLNINNDLIEN